MSDSSVPPRLLSSREFASALGRVPETIRRWVRQDKIEPWGRDPTGHYLFHPSQIEEFRSGMPTAVQQSQGDQAQVIALQVAADMRRRLNGGRSGRRHG